MEEPFLHSWLTHYALFSMFPLLARDKLVLPYIALSALFFLLNRAAPNRSKGTRETNSLRSFVTAFFLFCALILHVVYVTVNPPHRYPFLFEALIMLLCFSQFVSLTVYTNAKQWMMLKRSILGDKEKKLLWVLFFFFFFFWEMKIFYIFHYLFSGIAIGKLATPIRIELN